MLQDCRLLDFDTGADPLEALMQYSALDVGSEALRFSPLGV